MYCKYPWQEGYIDVAGNVRCCCFMQPYLGNLSDYPSFSALWNNAIVRQVRRAILRDEIHPYCNNVSCPHYGKYPVYTQSYRTVARTPLSHIVPVPGCSDYGKVCRTFDTPLVYVGCTHAEMEIVQQHGLPATEHFPEMSYNAYLRRCPECGHKDVFFRYNCLEWAEDLTDDIPMVGQISQYGNGTADVYLPIIEVGQGDVLMLLRFAQALKTVGKTLGILVPESYAHWEQFFPNLPIQHAFVFRNGLGVSADAYTQIRLFIKRHNLPTPSLELSVPYLEYLHLKPIMNVDTSIKTDILIHRRVKPNRYKTRNIESENFKQLVATLNKTYNVGVVGLQEEDDTYYPGDLRFLPFQDQITAVTGAQLVLDTDSLFDKVAEAVGVPSFVLYLEHYLPWGAHLKKWNDIFLCTNDLSEVSMELLCEKVHWFFNTFQTK